jgi:hypothetical protein
LKSNSCTIEAHWTWREKQDRKEPLSYKAALIFLLRFSIINSGIVNRTQEQAYLSLAMKTKAAGRFLELRKLERTNLPILLLLTFQRLLPTI